MCGICGHVGIDQDDLLEAMSEALVHRGPDDVGYFREGDVGLGHRRLSIIDLSGGHQPMENEDGSVLLIVNGEIYNYVELREELEARNHVFKTRSDSEVILHLYEEMGARCVERLVGMFAFAIYDRRQRKLVLARDRLGIKPLYYALLGERLLFASELKAILRYEQFDPTLDLHAVKDYLALRYVPGPGSLFREIQKLPAAHTATFERGRLQLERYWQAPLARGPFDGDERAYVEGFAEHFERSIRRRMIADVPLGAYLSGGLDSSVIVAAMSRLSDEPIRTFTVGFDYEHDELEQAADTARYLGCRHTEIACRAEDIELLPEVIYHLDEPIGDAIVVPMYQLAREAKKQVTVILAGEGADETLGGYLFHKALLWGHYLSRVPRALRQGLLTRILHAIPASVINIGFSYPAALGERGKQKVIDYLLLLDEDQLPAAYRHLISLFDERDCAGLFSDDFLNGLAGSRPVAPPPPRLDRDVPFLNRAIDLQFHDWLPDDILMKQDKMSMAHAIEARVPFLDHELVEYALRIPPRLKIDGRISKAILRRYAADLLPEETRKRRKMPFYVPVEKYLEQPVFKNLVSDILSDKTIRERGFFRPEAVTHLKQEIHRGEFMHVKQVLSLVILELWLRMAVDRKGRL